MTTMDAEPVFLDTNILVYAHFPPAPWHQDAVEALRRFEAAGAARWVSRQVLREYLVAVTRPQQFQRPQPIERALADVRDFQRRFHVANEGPEVTTRLLALLADVPTRGRRIHDANIVATMLVYGVRRVLTHNTDDFVRFAAFIEVIPLVPPPAPGPPPSA
jgi:predicted nucleic acid-binding protein